MMETIFVYILVFYFGKMNAETLFLQRNLQTIPCPNFINTQIEFIDYEKNKIITFFLTHHLQMRLL